MISDKAGTTNKGNLIKFAKIKVKRYDNKKVEP